MSAETLEVAFAYERQITDIANLSWADLSRAELLAVAWSYYYFSIQFRENLEIACDLYPDDIKLQQLRQEECDTANLSPWPDVAAPAERLDHDEFMRRLLLLAPIPEDTRRQYQTLGAQYLAGVRALDLEARALSIASYEDGGLETVFKAILTAPHWDTPALGAFRHFLVEHIKFDSDPEHGHGALSAHMRPDDRIAPLWEGFKRILVDFTPSLSGPVC